eukprot:gene14439-17068_t
MSLTFYQIGATPAYRIVLWTSPEDAKEKGTKIRYEGLKLLLDAGTDHNAAIQSGVTLLHTSAQKGYLPIVKMLLDRGAHKDAVTQ